ncbi:LysR family transcriptional regulator [Hoeflea poritis]|uniref:LysR family transcriptional regulator n=1 Tax=Hoeflea poritis TaxID=2993659 RepID=A0ABT4VHB7_9HYPH|nr:LysR family transcriptional regulator [Hoeflea poritis]MDA4844111.1 LysR family transcriptional regulator [Hoeflea poritis]
MQNPDWDIFRYVIAVVDSGSAVAAAERLGVNASTVLRKIAKFETDNGVRLFEKRQSGYRPTAECATIVEEARKIEQNVMAINRDLLGRDLRLEGRLAVTTTDSLLVSLLAPLIEVFTAHHPRIRVDVSVTNSRLNLPKQDADIAIRASKMPPDTLVGQRVSGLVFAVYAPAVFADGTSDDRGQVLGNSRWVGIGQALSASPVGEWMSRNVAPGQIAMTADTFVAVRDCALAGIGIAVLPCCLGDTSRGLVRLTGPISEMDTSLWVLTHSDIRGAARVKAFNEFVTRELRAKSALLEGAGV